MNIRKIILLSCFIGASLPLSFAAETAQKNTTDTFVLGPEMPSDFGFRYEYGIGGFQVLDTIQGTLTVDLLGNGRPSVPLKATKADLQLVFDALKKNKFDQVPEELQTKMTVTPSTRYRLTIWSDQRQKTFSSHDVGYSTANDSNTRAWKKIIEVMDKVLSNHYLFDEDLKRELKKLPPQLGAYE